jgi:hypothetical protein
MWNPRDASEVFPAPNSHQQYAGRSSEMSEAEYKSESSTGDWKWTEPSPDPDDRYQWMLTVSLNGQDISKFISPAGRVPVEFDSRAPVNGRLVIKLEPRSNDGNRG